MKPWRFALIACLLTAGPALAGQSAEPQKETAVIPAVGFTLDFPGGEPSHFSILVKSTGEASYESRPQVPEAQSRIAGDPYLVKFTISQETRTRIFELAKALNSFQGNFDYRKHRIANTGTKTASYTDANRHFETSYNWSENRDLQQLTAIFHAVANTLESGRRLVYLHRYDKLGLDKELRQLESLEKSGEATELAAIAPQLEQIAADGSVMNLARERAKRLLQSAGPEKANAAASRD